MGRRGRGIVDLQRAIWRSQRRTEGDGAMQDDLACLLGPPDLHAALDGAQVLVSECLCSRLQAFLEWDSAVWSEPNSTMTLP